MSPVSIAVFAAIAVTDSGITGCDATCEVCMAGIDTGVNDIHVRIVAGAGVAV